MHKRAALIQADVNSWWEVGDKAGELISKESVSEWKRERERFISVNIFSWEKKVVNFSSYHKTFSITKKIVEVVSDQNKKTSNNVPKFDDC